MCNFPFSHIVLDFIRSCSSKKEEKNPPDHHIQVCDVEQAENFSFTSVVLFVRFSSEEKKILDQIILLKRTKSILQAQADD